MNLYSILLSLKKSFINDATVVSLGYRINAFGFIIIADKLKAIFKLDFLYILKDLKSFIDLIG